MRDLIGSDMDFTREVEQVRDEAKDIVEAWLTMDFGEKCPEYCETCECCARWRLAERLFSDQPIAEGENG